MLALQAVFTHTSCTVELWLGCFEYTLKGCGVKTKRFLSPNSPYPINNAGVTAGVFPHLIFKADLEFLQTSNQCP